MKVLRAIGMTIAIISLRVLMPHVWQAFEQTLLSFFGAMQNVLAVVGNHNFQATANTLFAPPMYPQVPR